MSQVLTQIYAIISIEVAFTIAVASQPIDNSKSFTESFEIVAVILLCPYVSIVTFALTAPKTISEILPGNLFRALILSSPYDYISS